MKHKKKQSWPKIIVLTFTIALITGMVGGALTNEYLIAYLFGQLTERQQEELPIVKKVIEEKTYIEESKALEAIELTKDSLVLISDIDTPSAEFKAINSDLFYRGFAQTDIAADVNQSLAASGIVLTTDGLIATCNSFVQNRNSWFVILNNGEIYNAQVVYRDAFDDIALIKISSENEFKYFNTLSFMQQPLQVGQKALAVGSFNKAKSGIVSFLPELPEQRDHLRLFSSEFIQVDYEVDSGLSCGPLINLGGELIGLTLDFDTVEQGTSYIIPSSALNDALEKFKLTLQ